jgi:uncharacterized protein YajQ (UPF0234 family)
MSLLTSTPTKLMRKAVIGAVRAKEFPVALQFVNFRE